MGTFNYLVATAACPFCGEIQEMSIESKFGLRNQLTYRIGDAVRWVPRRIYRNGGRPAKGAVGEWGYADCSSCGRDFFVQIEIDEDVIKAVRPSGDYRPYEPMEDEFGNDLGRRVGYPLPTFPHKDSEFSSE